MPSAAGTACAWCRRANRAPARGWLQKAGSGGARHRAKLDADTLALPPVIAVFDDKALNRDLYLWLAALAAVFRDQGDWIAGNRAATARVLQLLPAAARAGSACARTPRAAARPASGAEAVVRPHCAMKPCRTRPSPRTRWRRCGVAGSAARVMVMPGRRRRRRRRQGRRAARPRRRTRRRVDATEGQARPRCCCPPRPNQLMSWAEHNAARPRHRRRDDGNAQRRRRHGAARHHARRPGRRGAHQVRPRPAQRQRRRRRHRRARRCPSGTGSASLLAARPLPRRHADGAARHALRAGWRCAARRAGAPPPGAARRAALAAPLRRRRTIDLDAWVRHAADAGEDDAASAARATRWFSRAARAASAASPRCCWPTCRCPPTRMSTTMPA